MTELAPPHAEAIASFQESLSQITSFVTGRSLDGDLQAALNTTFPSTGEQFRALDAACTAGVTDGWLCEREAGGIRYGRVLKPSPELHGFSVDVVDMEDVVGPHHRHPQGEIDLVLPVDEKAQFDGHGAGWVVYGEGSEHPPTVTGGRALVLYLLPGGAIEFTRS